MAVTPTSVTDAELLSDSVAAAVVYNAIFEVSAGEQVVRPVLLGGWYPQAPLPARSGYKFLGYYENRYGVGKQYYSDTVQCLLPDDQNYWDRFSDMTFYAAWELTLPPSDPIVVKSGETNVIDGSMANPQYVQDATTPLFTVEAGGCLVLKNLTVVGSEAYASGVIANAGEVVVSNCAFRSCGSKGDGGLYSGTSGSRAHFIRCTFDGCVANEGGAIAANASEVSVLESTFCYNSSMTETAGRPGGAAVSAKGGARVNVVSCTFVDNFTQVTNGAVLAIAEGAVSTSDIFNNAFQLAGNCTRTYDATSLSSVSGYNLTADPGDLTVSNPRTIAGVEQTCFKPHNDLRSNGAAEKVFPLGAWPFYEVSATRTDEPLYDQVNQYPTAGGCGARTGNTLQHYIDIAAAGDTIAVAPGTYDAVTVDKRVTIVGTGDGCVIDGERAEPCVTFEAGGEDTVWNRFTFQNGMNIASGASPDGGGWTTPGDGDCYGIASNCVFVSCHSVTNGGGVAWAKEIAYSTITNCSALNEGGGTYGCQLVVGTVYRGNSAGVKGGASASDVTVRGCLLHQNSSKSGGGGSAGFFEQCTFACNAPEDSVVGAVVGSTLKGCLLYANKLPTDVQYNNSYELNGAQFVNASAGDFHLALRDKNDKLLTHKNVRITDEGTLVQAAGWLDLDRRPFVTVHPVSGEKYLYAGCYAYAPFKSGGLVVTGTDEWYRNSNAQTSLREAVETAAEFAPKTNGTLTVTFDEQLFAVDDTVVFNFTEAQTDMRAFTNVMLVVQGPTNHVAVIDGNRVARAFRIFPKNRVRFENLVFQNCFGLPYGTPQPGTDGGAVQNNGLAFFSNCVFRANRAGNNSYDSPNDDPLIGYGGALATGAGATSTVYAATFAGNRAAKGGAIWTADGGASHVFYSTFAGNIAEGSISVTDPQGGACAVERKTYLPNGGDLWLVNCLLAGNRVTTKADTGGAISGAKAGLVLLNSIVVGNFANNATNDIAMPSGSTSYFYYTAYGTRTQPTPSSPITYNDFCSTGGVAFADAICLTNGMPVVKIPMPQTVLPLATGFTMTGTNVWTTADYSTLGYGSTTRSSVKVLAGGTVLQLRKSGVMRTTNQVGESQVTNGVVMLGPTTITEDSIRSGGDDSGGDEPGGDEPGGSTPTYDDEDAVDEAQGVCYLVKIDGTTNYYDSVENALKHWQPGDFATVKSEDDETLNDAFFEAFDPKLADYAENRPWYDYSNLVSDYGEDSLKMSLTLNDKAMPTITGDFDVTSTEDTVSVTIGNVKPDLWYSLGRADSPEGPYVCDKWVQADGSGTLKGSLTAPKSGDSGFYRVIVAPYVR